MWQSQQVCKNLMSLLLCVQSINRVLPLKRDKKSGLNLKCSRFWIRQIPVNLTPFSHWPFIPPTKNVRDSCGPSDILTLPFFHDNMSSAASSPLTAAFARLAKSLVIHKDTQSTPMPASNSQCLQHHFKSSLQVYNKNRQLIWLFIKQMKIKNC